MHRIACCTPIPQHLGEEVPSAGGTMGVGAQLDQAKRFYF